MISKYVQEQKRYTQEELCRIFECSEEYAIPIIRKLKEYSILKAVRASADQKDRSDLIEEDIEIADVGIDDNEFLYIFTFVGIIVIAGRVLKCYPKYLNIPEPVNELRQILKVLEKYNEKEQIIRMFNDSSENHSFNLLAVMLFLLTDYHENGSYNNTKDIVESNGMGEIIWDKTINETFTLLSNDRPYYTDLQTKKRISNDYDYYKRLHECILTKISKELVAAQLVDLFEIGEVELSDEDIEDFGDKDYLLYRIEKELNIQFNTRKQLVLKTLYTYIERSGSLFDVNGLSIFGTNSFNLVWENVCKVILDNQLDVPLGLLPLPIPLKSGYDKQMKLIHLVEKPLWSYTGKCAQDTLIPDSITISSSQFIITDAKYYVTKLEKNQVPKAQPGIESITKQYLYQMAYQQFIEDHQFESIINCFIMPTETDGVLDKGVVSMKMFEKLGLKSIEVRFLSAGEAFEHYLSGTKISLSRLRL